MASVHEGMDHFTKKQMDMYERALRRRGHERILTTTGIDVLCAMVAGL